MCVCIEILEKRASKVSRYISGPVSELGGLRYVWSEDPYPGVEIENPSWASLPPPPLPHMGHVHDPLPPHPPHPKGLSLFLSFRPHRERSCDIDIRKTRISYTLSVGGYVLCHRS